MSIKKLLCIVLSLLFILGSISIIYANDNSEQNIDNDKNNNQEKEIKIIDKFEISYDDETHEQIPLFDFIISSEINIDDLEFPKTIKGYINNELVDIPVIEWGINGEYKDEITEEYITYIPIFNNDEYQLLNDTPLDIILPIGIIKFTDLAPMEKFNMLKDCDNCGLNGVFENIGSNENLDIDDSLNENEEEVSIQSTDDNQNLVRSSNYTTINANVGLPSSYYSTSASGRIERYMSFGHDSNNIYYHKILVWLPPKYDTLKAAGEKFNVVFLLNGGAGTITYNDDGTIIMDDGSTIDWMERSIENMNGKKLFTNLIKNGLVPENTIFAALHNVVGDSEGVLLNNIKFVLEKYPTYATYSNNNTTLLRNMKEYGCGYALVSLSASTWTATKFMSKYNGVINNYLMMSYGRKTASELIDSVNDTTYGKTQNLIISAGTNEEASWNNSSIKSIQYLADHAENAYYVSFANGNHNWTLWYCSVYFTFKNKLDCMSSTPSGYAYVLKESNIPDLVNNYPLTNIKFTIYTNANCTTIAKDTSGNDAILIVKKVGNKYKTDTIELEVGNYWIKETDSISNYLQNTEIKPFTIEEDKTEEIKYTNTLKTGKLKIKKTTDGSIFNPIGCKFTVYTDENCTQIAKMICIDENNVITIKNAVLTITKQVGNQYESDEIILPIGTYYVKETTAIEPFEICSSINNISINNNKTTTTSFDNIPKQAKATIIKTVTQYDLIDKFPIVGTTFTIYSEYIDETHYTIAKDIYTNEDAILIVKKIGNEYKTNTVTLLPGTYWIEETVTMPYYETIEGQSITLSKNENKLLEIENILLVGKGKVLKIWTSEDNG